MLSYWQPGIKTRWVWADRLGTVRDVVEINGTSVTVVEHKNYNSFGGITSDTNAGYDFRFGYTGWLWDSDNAGGPDGFALGAASAMGGDQMERQRRTQTSHAFGTLIASNPGHPRQAAGILTEENGDGTAAAHYAAMVIRLLVTYSPVKVAAQQGAACARCRGCNCCGSCGLCRSARILRNISL